MIRNHSSLMFGFVLAVQVSPLAAYSQNFGENATYYSPGYQNYQSGFGGTQAPPRYQNQDTFASYDRAQYAPNYQQPHTTMNSLEHELDRVDSNWNQVPVTQQQPYRASAQQQQQYAPQRFNPNQVTRGRRAVTPGSGPMMNAWQGLFPGVSKQELMRVFLEGGTPGSPMAQGPTPDNSGQISSARSTAYSNYQTAANEATRARNECNTAHYDHDKWNRKNAASRAEYAANNAEYAAERAESAANNGDAQARHYAGLARQEANRARASANQARYNANTIQ